jgi:hypothetical protein
MKVMVVWKAVPGKYQAAVEQFVNTGGLPPTGAKSIGRWHVPGSILGWHLIDADDMTALAQHMAEWADVLELEVYPVIEDAAAAKVFGRK